MSCEIEIKYVITDYMKAIIFFVHNHVDMEVHGRITSSGKMKIVNGKVETYGHSTSIQNAKDKDGNPKYPYSCSVPSPDDEGILSVFLGLR